MGIALKLLQGDVLSFARHYKGEPFHALLCDAPYHLTSITERFGKEGSAEAQYGKDGAFQRVSTGFMGARWDGGDISFRPETWKALGNLLYPGAFGMTFGGSRTAHRMAVAIEDAGFIIHPMIGWVYGSGFPKATRIDTQIDKNAPRQGMFENFANHFAEQREVKGLSQKEIAVNFPSKTGGLTGCVWNWENGANVPTLKQWKILQPILDLSDEYLPLIERIEAERKIVGLGYESGKRNIGILPTEEKGEFAITEANTPLAQSWEGHRYGLQALKPALEPIIVFQKPYPEGVRPIDSITLTGAGALNIDKSRISTNGNYPNRALNFSPSVACKAFDNTANKDQKHDVDSLFDILDKQLFLSGYDSQITRQSSSDAEYVRNWSSISNFLNGYQTFYHFCDALFHLVQADDQLPEKLQSGVLKCIRPFLNLDEKGKELKHSHDHSNNVHFLLASIFSFVYTNYTTPYIKQQGRWPANVAFTHSPDCQENLCVDGCPVKELDRQSGVSKSDVRPPTPGHKNGQIYGKYTDFGYARGHYDSGGASRFFHQSHYAPFFYQAKAGVRERNAGLREFDAEMIGDGRKKSIDNAYQRGETMRHNVHPTVKPIALTRHLATLLLPPEEYKPRRLFVPFAGTASEMIGAFQAGWECVIGVEMEKEYVDIGKARIKYWLEQGVQLELL